jgi:hypothetical protein
MAKTARQFKNTRTGAVWEVADPATLKRVLESPLDYEEVNLKEAKPDK